MSDMSSDPNKSLEEDLDELAKAEALANSICFSESDNSDSSDESDSNDANSALFPDISSLEHVEPETASKERTPPPVDVAEAPQTSTEAALPLVSDHSVEKDADSSSSLNENNCPVVPEDKPIASKKSRGAKLSESTASSNRRQPKKVEKPPPPGRKGRGRKRLSESKEAVVPAKRLRQQSSSAANQRSGGGLPEEAAAAAQEAHSPRVPRDLAALMGLSPLPDDSPPNRGRKQPAKSSAWNEFDFLEMEDHAEPVPSDFDSSSEDDEGSDDDNQIQDLDESESEEEEVQPNLNSLFVLNTNYEDHLNDLLVKLTFELQQNQARQQEIQSKLQDLGHVRNQASNWCSGKHLSINKLALSLFGHPYFKDKNLYTAPANPDTRKRRESKEPDPWIDHLKPWTQDERKELKSAVRKNILETMLSSLYDKKEELGHKLRKIGLRDEERAELEAELDKLRCQESQVLRKSDQEFYSQHADKIDWYKISVVNLKSLHTPEDCNLQWRNLLHPAINRGVWKPEEDILLLKLADATDSQDWDLICSELGTGRSPFLCFVRYMTKHNIPINNRRWSKKEDDRLLTLVSFCRINCLIPWSKVAIYMERRTKEQCYQRYMQKLRSGIRGGVWSSAEECLLILGHIIYGNSWCRIGEILPTRTLLQIYCHWENILNADHSPWSPDEINKLVESVKLHGVRDWLKVAQNVGTRNRAQCRTRFHLIYKYCKRNYDSGLHPKVFEQTPAAETKSRAFACFREELKSWIENELPTCNLRLPLLNDLDTSKMIELPEGLRLNCRQVTAFVRHLQSGLKIIEPEFTRHPRHFVRERITKENEILQLAYRKKPSLKELKSVRGKIKKNLWKPEVVRTKVKLEKDSTKTPIDRALAKLFRSSWMITVNTWKIHLSDEEIETGNKTLEGLFRLFGVSNARVAKYFEENDSDLPRLQHKVLDSYVTHLKSKGIVSSETTQCEHTASRVEVGSTNEHLQFHDYVMSNQDADKRVNLLPPNLSSLICFRGLLLHFDYLVELGGARSGFVRFNADVLMRNGVHNPDLRITCPFPDPFKRASKKKNRTLSAAEEADRKLCKRFAQMFQFPALMSTCKPNVKENIFPGTEQAEADEQMAANNPFDTSKIFEIAFKEKKEADLFTTNRVSMQEAASSPDSSRHQPATPSSSGRQVAHNAMSSGFPSLIQQPLKTYQRKKNRPSTHTGTGGS